MPREAILELPPETSRRGAPSATIEPAASTRRKAKRRFSLRQSGKSRRTRKSSRVARKAARHGARGVTAHPSVSRQARRARQKRGRAGRALAARKAAGGRHKSTPRKTSSR